MRGNHAAAPQESADHEGVNVFLLIALLLVAGGAIAVGAVWTLEKTHRIEPGRGDKVALIGFSSAIAGLPLLVVSLIYALA